MTNRCPHCNILAHWSWDRYGAFEKDRSENRGTGLKISCCPNCEEYVIVLEEGELNSIDFVDNPFKETMLFPQKSHGMATEYIPKNLYEEYEEALNVLSISPRASAALTRGLLQRILREQFSIEERTLSKEIEKFIQMEQIPSYLTDTVDAIRNIGNFAAHPSKDLSTGEVVQVEKGEAEWLIEIIEAMFDFAYVQPQKIEKRKFQLNEKLEKIGKKSI